MKKDRLTFVVYSALLTAMIMIATMFLQMPTGLGGYVHLGDGVIFIAAAVLGPWAGIAAALGSALSDLFAGYTIYVPATLIIKGLMGFMAGQFMSREGKRFQMRNLLVFVLAETVMLLGYFVYESMTMGLAAALGAVGFNLVQAAFGVAAGLIFTPFARRFRIEK